MLLEDPHQIKQLHMIIFFMWEDITALHVGASYLDPSLKGFSFVRDTEERRSLSEQAAAIVEENAMITVAQVYPPKGSNDSDVESLDNEEEEESEAANERAKKKTEA